MAMLKISSLLLCTFLICEAERECERFLTRDGIRMPRRRSLMSLQTFRTKATDTIWKPFYFGSTRPKATTFFKGEYLFYFSPNVATLQTEFSGVLPAGQCVDETSFPGGQGIGPKYVISNKAEFLSVQFGLLSGHLLGNSCPLDTYRMYFSSDPDSYLLFIECLQPERTRRCPLENYWVLLLVKRTFSDNGEILASADSLPLHRALYDIYQTTCLTLDDIIGDFRFLFMFGENPCPTPGMERTNRDLTRRYATNAVTVYRQVPDVIISRRILQI